MLIDSFFIGKKHESVANLYSWCEYKQLSKQQIHLKLIYFKICLTLAVIVAPVI